MSMHSSQAILEVLLVGTSQAISWINPQPSLRMGVPDFNDDGLWNNIRIIVHLGRRERATIDILTYAVWLGQKTLDKFN